MKRRKVTPQCEAQVVKMVTDGKTSAEIAKAVGISLASAVQIRSHLGGKKPGWRLSIIDRDLLGRVEAIQGCCDEIISCHEAHVRGDHSGPTDPNHAVQRIYDAVDGMKQFWPSATSAERSPHLDEKQWNEQLASRIKKKLDALKFKLAQEKLRLEKPKRPAKRRTELEKRRRGKKPMASRPSAG